MSDFIIYINIFCEFDNFKDWDAAQEKEKRLSHFGRCVTTPADGLVGAAVTCKKKNLKILTISIVLIIYLIFVYFVSDHGISGIMLFEVSIIRNKWTLRKQPFHASASSINF